MSEALDKKKSTEIFFYPDYLMSKIHSSKFTFKEVKEDFHDLNTVKHNFKS